MEGTSAFGARQEPQGTAKAARGAGENLSFGLAFALCVPVFGEFLLPGAGQAAAVVSRTCGAAVPGG
jgi:hypothetical protein